MKTVMCKEKGGVNWYMCKIIAEYDGKVWLHNLHVGSMPIKRKSSIMIREVDEHLAKCAE